MILDHFRVTEQNWREGAARDPNFLNSETPFFVGRAVAALAADPQVLRKSGGLYTSVGLAREYGFTDIDGSQQDIWENVKAMVPAPKTGIVWQQRRAS